MARNMEVIEQETMVRSLRIVNEKVPMLTKIWKLFFDDVCCVDYMNSLPSSIGMFLDEIFHMTMHHCARKSKEIQGVMLEISQLEGLLGVLPAREEHLHQHMSLDRRSMLLQQKALALRARLKHLYHQYVEEQNILCNELGNRQKMLEPTIVAGELPSLQSMTFFFQYVDGLRQEKGLRNERIKHLQADLRSAARQLDWKPRKPHQQMLMNDPNLPPTEKTIVDLDVLYNLVDQLLKGKRSKQTNLQPTEPAPLPDNLSPPPPPPSPEGDLAASSVHQSTQMQPQLSMEGSRIKDGMYEVDLNRYRQQLAECLPGADRERIVEDLFRNVYSNINLWWDRCLIPFDERKNSKVLKFTKRDEEALTVHIEGQEELKKYYLDNELLFQVVYQWSEWWTVCLKLEPNVIGGGSGAKMKKKTGLNAPDKEQLRQVKDQLATLEAQMKDLCDEFEQRNKKQFTIFGIPAMSLLNTLKKDRKELTIPSTKVSKPHAVDRKVLFNDQLIRQAPAPVIRLGDFSKEDPFACHKIEKISSMNDYMHDSTTSVSSSSDDEEDQDEVLLNEALALVPASKSTVVNKGVSMESVKAAQPKTNDEHRLVLSNITSKPLGMSVDGEPKKTVPLSLPSVIMETPANCVPTAAGTMLKAKDGPSVTENTMNVMGPNVSPNVVTAPIPSATNMDCAGTNKARTKSKQNSKREPSLII